MISWMRVRSAALNELLNLRLVKEYGFNRFVCAHTLITWIKKKTLEYVVRFNKNEDPSSKYFDINSEFVIVDNQFGYVKASSKYLITNFYNTWLQTFTTRLPNPVTALGVGEDWSILSFVFLNALHVMKMLLKKVFKLHLLWSIGSPVPFLYFVTKLPLWVNVQLPSPTSTLPLAAREHSSTSASVLNECLLRTIDSCSTPPHLVTWFAQVNVTPHCVDGYFSFKFVDTTNNVEKKFKTSSGLLKGREKEMTDHAQVQWRVWVYQYLRLGLNFWLPPSTIINEFHQESIWKPEIQFGVIDGA